VQRRLLRHRELSIPRHRTVSLIQRKPTIGDIFHPLSHLLLFSRRETKGPLDEMDRLSPFYLSAFVKKFTYSRLVQSSLFADNLIDVLTRIPTGAERCDFWRLAVGGETPPMTVVGGGYNRQNVDGRGLVFRRRRAVSAAGPARLDPDRPDPQLPIEEELYG
jgi:hypothetical protein